jgi:hypothetical protein
LIDFVASAASKYPVKHKLAVDAFNKGTLESNVKSIKINSKVYYN